MKIIHVIESLDLAKGGPSVGTTSFACAEAAQGHEVIIVCYDSPGHAAALAAFTSYPAFEQVKIEIITGGGFGEALTASRAGKVLERVLPGADFVSVHGVWRPMLSKAITIARKLGLAYSVTPHGMLDPWSLQQKAWKKKPAWNLVWREHCNHATFIRVLNNDEARLLLPLSLKAPLQRFANGVFPENYADLPAPGEFYKKYPQLRGRRFILFLSRLHYKKGLDYLIEAFSTVAAKIDDVDLVIAGPDEGASDRLELDIQRLGLGDRVHRVGPLYGHDKFTALVDATCFCLPSRQEGFSNAITEALASGTPVVISDACNFPEVAEVNAGRVVPLDAEFVAQGLIELLESPEACAEAGNAGKRLVFERFSWHAIIASWIQCIHEMKQATENGSQHARATTVKSSL